MSDKTPALRLGAPVRFADRWAGKVTAIEISEDWEVYNVAVRHGFFKAVTVRLPLETATGWDDHYLAFDQMAGKAAFDREVPPVAAPSRPISSETPIFGGGKLAGLLASASTRRATEVLIEEGGRLYRVPVASVSFDGKTMHAGVQDEARARYYTLEETREIVRRAVAADPEISFSELQRIEIETEGPTVQLWGNVRSKDTRKAARRAASAALGVPVQAGALVDDLELESEIGLALDRAGVTRRGEVYPRSSLGDVVLRGRVPTQGVADDAARVTARVPGVRRVVNLIEVGALNGERAAQAAAG